MSPEGEPTPGKRGKITDEEVAIQSLHSDAEDITRPPILDYIHESKPNEKRPTLVREGSITKVVCESIEKKFPEFRLSLNRKSKDEKNLPKPGFLYLHVTTRGLEFINAVLNHPVVQILNMSHPNSELALGSTLEEERKLPLGVTKRSYFRYLRKRRDNPDKDEDLLDVQQDCDKKIEELVKDRVFPLSDSFAASLIKDVIIDILKKKK